MKNTTFLFLFLLIANCWTGAFSQHCSPIAESYLSYLSLVHAGDSLKLNMVYCKTGGNRNGKAYQLYIIAYLEKDQNKLFALNRKDILKNSFCTIIRNDVIKLRNNSKDTDFCSIDFSKTRGYWFPYTTFLDNNTLAQKIIKTFQFVNSTDSSDVGGWGKYTRKFKLAVFIPLLDDTANSTDKQLPDDRHECNYEKLPYLLFQSLPFVFEIKYGIVMGNRLEKGNYYIHINNAN